MLLPYGKMSKLVIFSLLILTLTAAVSSASVQHHPFSELFPPDESLGFGGNDIENVSTAELSEIVPDQSDIIFRDAGDNPTLRWDESAGEWRLNGVNLNANGNSITDLDSLDGGSSAININDILQMNSNSINGINNLEFAGGTAYITQNSDGENILVQADDSSANRNNYIRVDPDNQTTSFPTGNVQILNGNLDMSSNSITNFFGSACPAGEIVADVDDDGTFNCVSMSDEVSSNYVARTGDSMTGNLDMTGNDILDIGNLGGSNIVNTSNINSGAVTSNELDETDSYSLGWNNLGIAQNDISVSNLGAADSNLDMNGNNINNFFGSACSSGNVVAHVNDDGTLDCVSAADEVQDTYVNRNGDSMTGNLDMGDNQIANLDLQNVNHLELDGNIEGAGIDMSITEVAEILGPANGDTDLNIQTQGAGSHVVSIEDGSSSNADIARFEEGTQNVIIPNGNLDLNGNSLTNFFGSACSSGNVAVHVNDDGSIDCADATGEVQDDFVNRNGDTMTGNLDMQGNNIVTSGLVDGVDVGSTGNAITTDGSNRYAVSSNSIALSELDEGSVDGRYVQLTGDVMSGSLDMNGNNINNFFGSACSSGNVVAHVNDDGTLDCVSAADEVQDTYVNRNGDSMTGNLDMSGNNINGVNTVNNGGTTFNTGGDLVSGGTVQASADLQTGSGTVTSSSEMCIGNQC